MVEFFYTHYAYWFTGLLLCIGLYGILMKRNLVKQTIGLAILQTSVVLFFVSVASKEGATVPVYDPEVAANEPENYINPLPHTLMLTAIVVGVATLGVAFTLLISIYKRYQTLEEDEILEDGS